MINREAHEISKDFQLISKPQIVDEVKPFSRAVGWTIGTIFISPIAIGLSNTFTQLSRPEISIISSTIIGGILAERASAAIEQNKNYFQLISDPRK